MSPKIINVRARFDSEPVQLFISVNKEFASTNPVPNETHYFNPETESKVYVYPYPTEDDFKDLDNKIPPPVVFKEWKAEEGELSEEQKKQIPLELTMTMDYEIVAKFEEVDSESFALITGQPKEDIDRYYSVHDGYFYKNSGEK